METQELLTRNEAAAYLGVTSDTMKVWAYTKIYKIPYRKVARKVQYLKSDLDQFIQDRTRYK